jgi:hypothetical protein
MEPTSGHMTRGFHVRPASPGDCTSLGPRLRVPDLAELRVFWTGDPAAAPQAGCAASEPGYAVTDETGKVLAIFGVLPYPGSDDIGTVWMMGSDDLVDRRLAFLRSSRSWLKVLQRRYRLLGNVVDPRNQVHVAWLRWMGFQVCDDPVSYGTLEKRPFLKFWLDRDAAPAALRDLPHGRRSETPCPVGLSGRASLPKLPIGRSSPSPLPASS